MDSPIISPAETTTKTVGRKKKQTPVATRNKAVGKKRKVNLTEDQEKVKPGQLDVTAETEQTQEILESEEENSVGSSNQVNIILSKLGTDLQQRMKVKRHRLESLFDSVRETPNAILTMIGSQTQERTKMVETFKAETKKIVDEVDKVIALQTSTEDKFSKMMLSTQKLFDQIKEALGVTVTGLNEAVDKLIQDTGESEGKHGEEAERQLQIIRQELGVLQKKILNEGKQEEAENIKNTLQLV